MCLPTGDSHIREIVTSKYFNALTMAEQPAMKVTCILQSIVRNGLHTGPVNTTGACCTYCWHPTVSILNEFKETSGSTSHWSIDFIRLNGWLRACFPVVFLSCTVVIATTSRASDPGTSRSCVTREPGDPTAVGYQPGFVAAAADTYCSPPTGTRCQPRLPVDGRPRRGGRPLDTPATPTRARRE